MADADWNCDRRLDLRGLACPLPVLKARKALSALPAGGRLLVAVDDPLATVDLPHFCREAGHVLVASARDGDAWRFLIARGPAGAGRGRGGAA